MKHFFHVIGVYFIAFVLILAVSYKFIVHSDAYDYISTVLLICVMSISSFTQYFIGMSNNILLQASQKEYIIKIFSIITTIINTLLVYVLVSINSSIIIIKLISSIIFSLKPLLMWLYVKEHFYLKSLPYSNLNILDNKWIGLGQHLAFFFHSNTDVVILTLFTDFNFVSVYSIYNMIVTEIQNITSSFASGMEALFGDLLANNEENLLYKTFRHYELIISYIALILFSITSVTIIPFIKIYTFKIEDINYNYPIFSLFLIISSMLYCLRLPYHSLIIAAGLFRQTQIAAYGEAIINISLSILLVYKLGLVGVVTSTIIAVSFRMLFYVIFVYRQIFHRKIKIFLIEFSIKLFSFIFIDIIGTEIIKNCVIVNFYIWILYSAIIGIISVIIVTSIMYFFYKQEMIEILNLLKF